MKGFSTIGSYTISSLSLQLLLLEKADIAPGLLPNPRWVQWAQEEMPSP